MENIFFVKYPRMYLVEDTFIGYVYKVRDKMDLFLNLSKALVFPNYFGENWDALCEVYRDFDWISNNDIVIIHEDLSWLDEYDSESYDVDDDDWACDVDYEPVDKYLNIEGVDVDPDKFLNEVITILVDIISLEKVSAWLLHTKYITVGFDDGVLEKIR